MILLSGRNPEANNFNRTIEELKLKMLLISFVFSNHFNRTIEELKYI